MARTQLAFRQLKLNSTDFDEDATNGQIKIKNAAITTAKIAASAVTSSKLADDGVTSAKVADGAITNIKVADGTIESGKIADGAVTVNKIGASAITNAKIQDGTIENAKLDTNAITNAKVANDAIGSAELIASSVTEGKLANNAVTIAKFQSLAASDIDKLFVGNATSGDLELGFLESRHFTAGHDYANITKIGAQAEDLNMNSNKIVNLALCTIGTDAANKAYVDSKVDGLMWKPPVSRATAPAGNTDRDAIDALNYDAGAGTLTHASNNTDLVIDGSASGNVVGTRILVQHATNAFEMGIYELTTAAAGGVAQVWTRASDADAIAELDGAAVFVTGGATEKDKGYVQVKTLANFTNASGNQEWVQFSALGKYSAGAGLTIDGAGEISISSAGVKASMIDSKRVVIKAALVAGDIGGNSGDIDHNDGLEFTGGENYQAGMIADSAQVFLNGILLRPASSAANATDAGDGDYFVMDTDGGTATDKNAAIRVAAGLVAVGDRLEIRYIQA